MIALQIYVAQDNKVSIYMWVNTFISELIKYMIISNNQFIWKDDIEWYKRIIII